MRACTRLCDGTTEYVQKKRHEPCASHIQLKQHECEYINRSVETQMEEHTDTQAGVQSPP